MEVDQAQKAATRPRQAIAGMREAFKAKMMHKKKKMQRPMKLSAKSKVISKGTSYSDKYEIRRAQRLSGSGRGNTSAAMNRLGQKHDALKLNKIKGIVMTKASKKKLLKKKARELKQKRLSMDPEELDWESASSSDEDVKVNVAASSGTVA